MIIEFIKFIVFSLGIVAISKYLLVPILRKIALKLNLGPKAVGNITGVATSVPELLTVCFSAASGFIGTSIYNILSSNVINLMQYTFSIYLNKNQKHLKNRAIITDIVLVLITILIPVIIVASNIQTGVVTVIIFVILLAVFYYINNNVHKLYLQKEDKEIEAEEIAENKPESKKNIILYWIALIAVAVLLYIVGELLSTSLTNLSNSFGLPEFVLGILLGFITSLPELITFSEAQKKEKAKNSETANKLGVIEATNNLLTSNILNLFVIQSIGIVLYLIIS